MSVFTYCAAGISTGVLGKLSLIHCNSRICKFLTSSSALYCELNNDFDTNELGKKEIRNKSENPNKFRDKNEFQGSASSSKKNKFKGGSNAKSTKLESTETNLPKNDLKDSKKAKDDFKKLKIKDVITDHDLKTKIKAMLRHIEKGEKVYCEVFGKNKLEQIFTKLCNSELQRHLVNSVKHAEKINIIFKKKETEEQNVEVQDKGINKTP